MTVDFGLALLAGSPPGKPASTWLDVLDEVLPQLQGHYRSLWMTDHFFWGDDPTHEAWTAMCYLLARFPQYEVGPMVLGQSYRNPALLAKMGATLQVLSEGRFIMGIGAGWKEDEYRAYGYDFPPVGVRIEQLEDTLEILKRMWTEPGKVTYHGKHYHVEDAYCEPKPEPVPPMVVGAGGRKTMMLAARYADWWNLSDANAGMYADRLTTLKQHCETIGRDPASIRLTWFGRLIVGRTQAEAEALSVSPEQIFGALRLEPYTKDNAFVGTPAQIVEQMMPFVEMGVDYFMTDILGLPNPDIIGMVLEEILPQIRHQSARQGG
jgi:alkanesulfonate monooxygenase SsuD/methylene tetrahydromethanopterin reductase-like flavin-dependent oxidoreductase (luciferase family)